MRGGDRRAGQASFDAGPRRPLSGQAIQRPVLRAEALGATAAAAAGRRRAEWPPRWRRVCTDAAGSGKGDSFWQFRPYRAGDAPARIDWRQSGKGDAHLRARNGVGGGADRAPVAGRLGLSMHWRSSATRCRRRWSAPSCCCWRWPRCCCAAASGCGCWGTARAARPLEAVAASLAGNADWRLTACRRTFRRCPAHAPGGPDR